MWNKLGSIPPPRAEPMFGTSWTRVLPGLPTNLKWLSVCPLVSIERSTSTSDQVVLPPGWGSSPFHRLRHEAAPQLLVSVSDSCSGSKIPYKETGDPVCGLNPPEPNWSNCGVFHMSVLGGAEGRGGGYLKPVPRRAECPGRPSEH